MIDLVDCDYGFEYELIDDNWYDVFDDLDDFLNCILEKMEEFGIISIEGSAFYFVFADDKLLRELNLKYLGVNNSTNVLSFPYEIDDSGLCVFGEIFLSYTRLKEESLEYCIPFIDHCCRMIIHGVLHICGYDHKSSEEEKVMEGRELEILESLGFKHTINR